MSIGTNSVDLLDRGKLEENLPVILDKDYRYGIDGKAIDKDKGPAFMVDKELLNGEGHINQLSYRHVMVFGYVTIPYHPHKKR